MGAGLTGSVIARTLADAGRKVLVVDRRAHLGGNVFDHVHESGIRIHTYGPHYFRTHSDDIWRFVNRFATFYRYEACVVSHVRGSYENWPIAGSYIRRVIGEKWTPEFSGKPMNFEQAALSLMPRKVYETFVKEYNEKQWGVSATELSAELCKRFEVRENDDPRLMPHHKYQGIPVDGYANMMKRMLDGIPVWLNCDYLQDRSLVKPTKMTIFTGPIDEFFNHSLGWLKYRGQRRTTEFLPNVDRYQVAGQVNEPLHEGGPHIRTLEWKQMLPPGSVNSAKGTVITREVPFTPDHPQDYEYPFPDEANKRLYQAYRAQAEEVGDVLICGRLGEYKYFDMDHSIARAIVLSKRLAESDKIREAA